MRNPFKKHNEDHNDVWDVLTDVTFTVALLQEEVEVLRQEVDYLVAELEDLDD
jgi:cell division protein FtsB